MVKGFIRFAFRTALVAAFVFAARIAMKRWIEGPEVATTPESWSPIPSGPSVVKPRGVTDRAPINPPARPEKAEKARPAVKAVPAEARDEPPPETGGAPEPAKKAAKAVATKKATNPKASEPWVAPKTDGSAPASHPVKAKISSRIYHLPGMAFYDRTTPDRCYTTAEAAEADGFSRG